MCTLYPTLNNCPNGTPAGTAPANTVPGQDTDGDGTPDYLEIIAGSDPTDPNDPVNPGVAGGEPTDNDNDNIPDSLEHVMCTLYPTLASCPDPSDTDDSDGDGVPDYIEVLNGTDPEDINDPVTGGLIANPGADSDSDGLPDITEINGNNGGDGNGDGIPDVNQSSVASVSNPATGGYTTIESFGGNCQVISDAGAQAEAALAAQDPGYDYPVGIFDYELSCTNNGDATTVKIYLDQQYSTANWVLRKYNSATNTYSNFTGAITTLAKNESVGDVALAQGIEAGSQVTVIEYQIQDGDGLDEDGTANATITDPIGPGTVVVQSSGGGGGSSSRRYCRDPEASNYSRFGKENNSLCVYDEDETEEPEKTEEQKDDLQERLDDLLEQVNGQNNTSSVCAPYLTKTIAFGRTNDSVEVNKLIRFLNEQEGENLAEDGSYDRDDFEAVKRFQAKYASSVLEVWGLTKPTGYVYLTTRMKINSFKCNKSLQCPVFSEFNSRTQNNESDEVMRTKVFMTELGFYNGIIDSNYDNGIYQSMVNFQETFAATMLKPWGLTKGTGYKYKTTNKFMNELVGCTTQDLVLENGTTVSY